MNWIAISRRLVGQPYELGKMDCAQLFRRVCEMRGIPVPDGFDGVTWKTYPEAWQRDEKATRDIFVRFVASMGREIPIAHAFCGDILIMRIKGHKELNVGIHAGNDGILVMTLKRAQVMNMRIFEIQKAIRISNDG